MKSTIHVFSEYGNINKVERYWQECFYHPDFESYNINLIEGNYLKQDNLLLSKTLYYQRQYEIFLELVRNRSIKKDDIIVFADSFNLIAPIVKQLVDEFKLSIKLVAFWNPVTFHYTDPNYKSTFYPRADWRNQYERLIINTFDYNCFFDERQLISFRQRLKSAFSDRCYVTGLPFEYLEERVRVEPKNNTIIFPADVNQRDENTFFNSIGQHLESKYRYIKLDEKPSIRSLFKGALPFSNAIFFPTYKYYHIAIMYEAMLHGVVPIVPDYSIYSSVVPDEYQYKNKLISKRNKGLRGKFEMDDTLELILDEYDPKVVINQSERIKGKFKNRSFINILNK